MDLNRSRHTAYGQTPAGRRTAAAVLLAVLLTGVLILFTACTSKDGGTADTNTMKETTTQRVPDSTVTLPVTDNVHDNGTEPGGMGTDKQDAESLPGNRQIAPGGSSRMLRP